MKRAFALGCDCGVVAGKLAVLWAVSQASMWLFLLDDYIIPIAVLVVQIVGLP